MWAEKNNALSDTGYKCNEHETFNLRLLQYNNNNVQATFTIYPQKKKKTKQILHSKPYEWIHIAKQFANIFKSDMWVICLFKLSFPAESQDSHDWTIFLRLTNGRWGPCTPLPLPFHKPLRFLNICNCLESSSRVKHYYSSNYYGAITRLDSREHLFPKDQSSSVV